MSRPKHFLVLMMLITLLTSVLFLSMGVIQDVSATPWSGSPLQQGLLAYRYSSSGNPPTTDPFIENQFSTSQVDTEINFGSGTIDNATRWRGYVYAPTTGSYTFRIAHDDGARLWVDGDLLIDEWMACTPCSTSGQKTLTGGLWYPLVLEHYNGIDTGTMQLYWMPPGSSEVIIPGSNLGIDVPTHQSSHVVDNTFNGGATIQAVDIDSDGDKDIVGAANTDNDIAWWENDGTGKFTKIIIDGNFGGASSAYAINLDGDDDIDILATASISDTVAWWENDGNQSFTYHVITSTFDGAFFVQGVNLDRDTDMDIVAVAENGGDVDNPQVIMWWENDGDQNFTAHSVGLGSNQLNIHASDIDGDNEIDIVGSHFVNGQPRVSWWRNDGSETFTRYSIEEGPAYTNYYVYVADIGNDEDMDLVDVAGTRLRWIENDGSETFGAAFIQSIDEGLAAPSSVKVADINNDGRKDIVASDANAALISWWENAGGDRFVEHPVSTSFTGAKHIQPVDLDNDGDVDILGAGDTTITWWENDIASPNQPQAVSIQTPPNDLIPNTSYVFTASVDPPTTTLPLVYRWEATDHTVVTRTQNSLNGVTSFNWHSLGNKNITVTVTNFAGQAIGTHSVVVGNPNSPVASNLQISPDYPRTDNSLTVSYDYSDPDGDPEGETQIRWYKDDVIQPSHNNSQTIPYTDTLQYENWCATVEPHDGENFGNVAGPICTIIHGANTLPEANSVILSPAYPIDNNNLSLSYTFYDNDGDTESDTEIRWYRNGTLQSAFSDNSTLSADETYLGETWCATVRPYDGNEYGAIAESNCVIIGTANRPPEVKNTKISPSSPTTNDDLTLNFEYFDPDGDPEIVADRKIRWYRDGILQPLGSITSSLIIPYEATIAGEMWYATIMVSDGQNHSLQAQTPPILISESENTVPTLSDVRLTLTEPGTNQDLQLTYNFIDVDGDADQTTKIYWYKWDSSMEVATRQTTYDGQKMISAALTEVGDIWYAIIVPSDGIDEGDTYYTHSVSVQETSGNTTPELLAVNLYPKAPGMGSSLELDYVYSDRDRDPEGDTQIRWYRDDTHEPAFDNQSIIPPGVTVVGQRWRADVVPDDGPNISGAAFIQSADTASPVSSNEVTIQSSTQNQVPVVENLRLEPARPSATVDLRVRYDYIDDNPKSEYATRIRWYKNGQAQPAYIDLTDIPAELMNPGDEWKVSVQPHDGDQYNNTIFETEAVIINTPPMYAEASIIPSNPVLSQSLKLNIPVNSFYDADNDAESFPRRIRWYRDGVHLSDIDDNLYVPGFYVGPIGSVWYATVTPHDGVEFGTVFTTTSVEIGPNHTGGGSTYLPIISKPKVLENCSAETFYEENDSREQVTALNCNLKLIPGQEYIVKPEDIEDIFYIDITRTTSIKIEVENYHTAGGSSDRDKRGQLLLYNDVNPNQSQAAVRYLQGYGVIPNGDYPNGGKNLINRHYIRIYTYPETQTDIQYLLKVTYLK